MQLSERLWPGASAEFGPCAARFRFPPLAPIVRIFGLLTAEVPVPRPDAGITGGRAARPEDDDDHCAEAAPDPRADPARHRAHRGARLHAPPEPGGRAHD